MSRSPQADNKSRKLSNFLCFAVYSANLAFGRAYKPILEALGLTYTQYIALVALGACDFPARRAARLDPANALRSL